MEQLKPSQVRSLLKLASKALEDMKATNAFEANLYGTLSEAGNSDDQLSAFGKRAYQMRLRVETAIGLLDLLIEARELLHQLQAAYNEQALREAGIEQLELDLD
jgi:hypothetical protein